MSRKDNRPYTFHCTEKTPFRGGLRDGVSVVHSAAHQSHHNGHRQCRWCYADLGMDFARSWELEERKERDKDKSAAEAKQAAELIRRISLSIDGRNGTRPTQGNPRKEPLVQVPEGPDGVVG